MNYEAIWVFLTITCGTLALGSFVGLCDGNFRSKSARNWAIGSLVAFILIAYAIYSNATKKS